MIKKMSTNILTMTMLDENYFLDKFNSYANYSYKMCWLYANILKKYIYIIIANNGEYLNGSFQKLTISYFCNCVVIFYKTNKMLFYFFCKSHVILAIGSI